MVAFSMCWESRVINSDAEKLDSGMLCRRKRPETHGTRIEGGLWKTCVELTRSQPRCGTFWKALFVSETILRQRARISDRM